MFLKSNAKKSDLLPSPGQRSEGLDLPRGILRERAIEHSKSMDFDKVEFLNQVQQKVCR